MRVCVVCCVSVDSDVAEEEEREELMGGALGRTFSFLRKMSIRRGKVTPKARAQHCHQ